MKWSWVQTVILAVIALLIVGYAAFPIFLAKDNLSSNITTWLIIAILLAIFLIVVGYGITGQYLGILIDDRNRMSLSRFQLVLWTIVILSSWLAAAIWNLAINPPAANPLGIAIPGQIWALLGISTTSLVVTPIILKEKAKRSATTKEKAASVRRIATQQGQPAVALNLPAAQPAPANETPQARVARTTTREDQVNAAANAAGVNFKGQVVARTSADQASVADLFQGDEAANAGYVDVGKVQMFFFTLILVLAYSLAIGSALTVGANLRTLGIHSFPVLDEGMVALLAISHAGYLGYKAAPRTSTTSDTAEDQ